MSVVLKFKPAIVWALTFALAAFITSGLFIPVAAFFSEEMQRHSGIGFSFPGLVSVPSAMLFSIIVMFPPTAFYGLLPSALIFGGWEISGRRPNTLIFGGFGGIMGVIAIVIYIIGDGIPYSELSNVIFTPKYGLLPMGIVCAIGAAMFAKMRLYRRVRS